MRTVLADTCLVWHYSVEEILASRLLQLCSSTMREDGTHRHPSLCKQAGALTKNDVHVKMTTKNATCLGPCLLAASRRAQQSKRLACKLRAKIGNHVWNLMFLVLPASSLFAGPLRC